MSDMLSFGPKIGFESFGSLAEAAFGYAVDAWQRMILFADVQRQRGDRYRAHLAETVPHVLNFKAELIASGRLLERPVNYGLVRIVPPEDQPVDPRKRPFVVVDPRARGTAPASAVSRRTARSTPPSRRDIPVISSASRRTPSRTRRWRIRCGRIRPSNESFRITWSERRFQDGGLAETSRWTAILTIVAHAAGCREAARQPYMYCP